MFVGDPRQLVEPAAGKSAEAVEMRPELPEILGGQIMREQVAQAAVDGVEILARAIRRNVIGAAAGSSTRPIIRQKPQPSTRAASSSSLGMPWK